MSLLPPTTGNSTLATVAGDQEAAPPSLRVEISRIRVCLREIWVDRGEEEYVEELDTSVG